MKPRAPFKTFTRPAVGPIASALALALAAGLAAQSVHAAKTEARLKAEVAALATRSTQAELTWQAKLTACRTQAAEDPAERAGLTRVTDSDAMAARLATNGPQGFDVCARMEAADAAVLASLHEK